MTSLSRMVSPVGLTFEYWFSTLTNDFPNDIIPVGVREDDWRTLGNIVAGSPTFAQAGIPNTDSFGNWQNWAERIYAILG